MTEVTEHDNNTIIIIQLPEVTREQVEAMNSTEELVKLENNEEEDEEEEVGEDKDKEKTILCVLCNRGFKHNSSLKRHLQLHDENKSQSYECTICMKKLQYNSSLKRHMKLHCDETKDKIYTCNICQKTFGYLTSLVRHHKLHSEVKKEIYTCDLCNKTFVYSSSLKRHVLLHTEGKTFECPTCNKLFGYATSLARHVRLHTSRQDYACLVCRRTLRSEKSYLRHVASCQRKNGVLETIEINDTKDDEEIDDNFFSDTVKSEEISQSSHDDEQGDDMEYKDEEESDHATMATVKRDSIKNEGVSSIGDDGEVSLASVAAQFENESQIVYRNGKRELRDSDKHLKPVKVGDTKDITDSDISKSFSSTEDISKDPMPVKSAMEVYGSEMSEGEAARSLINIGISESAVGNMKNSILITPALSRGLLNLVNAAVVQSEQISVTKTNATTDDNSKPVKHPSSSNEGLNNGESSTEISSVESDVQAALAAGSLILEPVKKIETSQEGNGASSMNGYELGVEDPTTGATATDAKILPGNSGLGHRFVATINGKEVELQLAAGSEILQYVVPNADNQEEAFIISQPDHVNQDGAFLVEAPDSTNQADDLTTVPTILEAVYVNEGEKSVIDENNKVSPMLSTGEEGDIPVETVDVSAEAATIKEVSEE